MVDACTLAHPGGGEPAYDEVDGISTVNPQVPYYSGRCLVKTEHVLATEEAGGEQVLADRWPAELPASVDGVRRGDIFTLTASEDPDLLGLVAKSLRVGDVDSTQLAASRRIVLQRNG